MRHEVVFSLNGTRRVVAGPRAFASLTGYLRDELGLVGTKIGCAEGDCGACTVLIGRPDGDRVRYRPATSCLLTLAQVDAAHVVTVEGLGDPKGDLTAVQRAMVECHASQCGYCTPGFVMALTALFEADDRPDEDALRAGLGGNLCRCTGYLPILDAGRRAGIDPDRRSIAARYPHTTLLPDLRRLADESLRVEGPDGRIFHRPRDRAGAVTFRAENPGCTVVSGGTDIGVWRNRRGFDPPVLLSLAHVADFARVERSPDGAVSIGAGVTWADLEDFARREAPGLLAAADHFAGPAIRHLASFVGNVAGGSPIADAVAFLHVLGARLELLGPAGSRWVDLADFGTGYRETVLERDEIIARIVVRVPRPDERLGLYKVSKRKEMDVSTFRAAILVGLDPSGSRIDHAALTFAGVGPTVVRVPEAEAALVGRPATEATFRRAGHLARRAIEPISDHRASRDHRLILAENVVLKFYRDHVAGPPSAEAGQNPSAGGHLVAR